MTGNFKHSVEIQVRFSDIDLQGHVSNTVYQTYFDCGKTDYFDRVIGEIDWTQQAIVGASVKIDYLKPIFLKTRIAVKSRVSNIGNKSMTFEHCIVNCDTGEVLSTCTAILVCFSPKLQQSVLVPDRWRQDITQYEGWDITGN